MMRAIRVGYGSEMDIDRLDTMLMNGWRIEDCYKLANGFGDEYYIFIMRETYQDPDNRPNAFVRPIMDNVVDLMHK